MSSNTSTGQIIGTVVGAVVGYFLPGSYVAISASISGMTQNLLSPSKVMNNEHH